ncbi:MAG TPA: DmsE family decaheme c-type cytochrome [Candidatus Binatia bacterium]
MRKRTFASFRELDRFGLLVQLSAVLLLLLVSATAAWPEEAPVPGKEPTYVGSEVCKACHVPQFEKFSQTQMGKIFLFNARSLREKQACESCHGPGSNHVAAGGGRGVGGLITFRKDSGESAQAWNGACLQCHEKGIQTYWEASPHASRGLSCVNCHTVMQKTTDRHQLAKLDDKTPFFTKRADIEVCGQCHLQRKAQLMRSSHMPMREGKIGCSDCHNPHGGPNPSQLKQASINENCYTCHTERRGPFLWEHPPAFENCANCHEPHGSVNDRLLKVTDPRLCTQCHMVTQHPANPRGRTSVFFFNRSCTNCHSQIHGSNHPAGMFYQR